MEFNTSEESPIKKGYRPYPIFGPVRSINISN